MILFNGQNNYVLIKTFTSITNEDENIKSLKIKSEKLFLYKVDLDILISNYLNCILQLFFYELSASLARMDSSSEFVKTHET